MNYNQPMTLDLARKRYETTWQQLLDLANTRNLLIQQLASMAHVAGEFYPANGILIEFNVDRAQSILAQLQEVRSKLFSTIEELNRYAAQIGKPRIERKRLDF